MAFSWGLGSYSMQSPQFRQMPAGVRQRCFPFGPSFLSAPYSLIAFGPSCWAHEAASRLRDPVVPVGLNKGQGWQIRTRPTTWNLASGLGTSSFRKEIPGRFHVSCLNKLEVVRVLTGPVPMFHGIPPSHHANPMVRFITP